MTISQQVVRDIITKLLKGEDYRIEVVNLINAEFLQYTVNFFKKIVDAKLSSKDITIDWYKKYFLDNSLTSEEIAIHSGLNKKTISNMYNSATRKIVIQASNDHYEELYETIKSLTENTGELNINLTIKLKDVSVELDLTESLIVINTLAVKRSALRGGFWSTAGKRVEKPLMITLCKLFQVKSENYSIKIKKTADDAPSEFEREIDFYLLDNKEKYKCETKLMGKGNPESADVVIARDSRVFVGDKLSDTNKKQLDSLNIEWVELRAKNGFRKFGEVLKNLGIPYKSCPENYKKLLEKTFKEIFGVKK